MFWKPKSKIDSAEYKELLDLIVKVDARSKMQDAEIANILDQLKRFRGRAAREKPADDSEDSNTKNILVAV